MVRHIVIWKLKETNSDLKRAILGEFQSRLLALKEFIPGIIDLHVHVNASEAPSSNDDIALIADFTDWEALNSYQVHPVHQNLASWVSGVRLSRAAIDFEL